MPPALRLGNYIVEGLLGPGGVTETYLAHLAPEVQDESTRHLAGKLFALKLLRSDRVESGNYANVAQRFLAAGRQLRDFHRPGFGKVVDLSEDPAATFIVTEHVAGTDLASLVVQSQAGREERHALDPVLAGLIGSEIARILHVGHSAKPSLCHLGLSPHNVMLTTAGEVVLLDAGLASALRAITEQPAERWLFVAPELQNVDVGAVGLRDRQGVAADLYSLGALVYFLVTGRVPTPPDLPGVSSNLGAALRTLLSSECEDRPESAAVLVDWLASGVDAARDRRQLIAEGLSVAEHGPPRAVESLPVSSVQPKIEPPVLKTPGSAVGKPAAVKVAKVLAKAPASAASSRRRSIAGSVAVAVVLAAVGVGVMALMGRWPGQKKTSPVQNQGQNNQHSQDNRASSGRRPLVANVADDPAQPRGGEEPRAPESAAGDSPLANVAGHLIVETVPPGATIWVDGVIKGKSFADIVVGEGGHRIVLTAPGHRMFRDVVDTSRGVILRRTLVPVYPPTPPTRGNGFIDVFCWNAGKYPILIDDEETGLLCPVKMVPISPGKHMVGIFIPSERRTSLVETTVTAGAKPAVVKFSE